MKCIKPIIIATNLSFVNIRHIQSKGKLLFIAIFLFVASILATFAQGGSQSIHLNFGTEGSSIGTAPWNNVNGYLAGTVVSNLIDQNGNVTTKGVSLLDSWGGYNNIGMSTGIYPADVTSTFLYLDDDVERRIQLSGLSTSKKYTFTFFSSRDGDGNRLTEYSINGASVSLNASYNTSNTVQIINISPDAAGNVTVIAKRGPSALYGYINAMVIEEHDLQSIVPSAPSAFSTDIGLNSFTANWNSVPGASDYLLDVSNSMSFVDFLNGYNNIPVTSTSLKINGLQLGATYYFRVRARNSSGISASSTAVSVTTLQTNQPGIYLNFGTEWPSVGTAPWNNVNGYLAGTVVNNLIDQNGNATTKGVSLLDNWGGYNNIGMSTGIYPADVTSTFLYLDDDVERRIQLSGLSTSKKYTFTFFSSRDGDGNRLTEYSINGASVSLNASYNTSNTVQIINISPDAAGNVTVIAKRGPSALYGYINAMVIEELTEDFTPQYNGNISAIEWGTEKNNAAETALEKRRYEFSYDSLNRITSSAYAVEGVFTGVRDETGIRYDENGNILSLKRTIPNGTGVKMVDDLVYTYNSNTNQLARVTDNGDDALGFIEGTNTDNDYAYDANGNLRYDKNKKIAYIRYNYLNLPELITFLDSSKIKYIYDASGVKLQKIAITTAGVQTVTDYCGELEFIKTGSGASSLDLIHTEEGYVSYNGSSTGTYQYFLKDHLGNTRVVIDQSGTVTQKTDYYPFGSTSWTASNSVNNRYLYNGKEKQDEFGLGWYDYGARFYDPQIGRWHSVDPLTEALQENLTPYHYCLNNPVLHTDPDGRIVPLLAIGLVILAKAAVSAAIDAGTQYAVNRAQGRSHGEAIDNIDRTSVYASGLIGGFSAPGVSTALKTTVKVSAIAADAMVDINSKGVETVRGIGGAKEKPLAYAVLDVTFGTIGNKSSDGVISGSKKAIADDLKPSNFAPLDKAGKKMVKTTENIVNSKLYEPTVETGSSFILSNNGVICSGLKSRIGSNAQTSTNTTKPKFDFTVKLPSDETNRRVVNY